MVILMKAKIEANWKFCMVIRKIGIPKVNQCSQRQNSFITDMKVRTRVKAVDDEKIKVSSGRAPLRYQKSHLHF